MTIENLHWPQITWLVLVAIGLLLHANKHGQPRTGEYCFWSHLVGVAISIAILYCGGFFS